MATYIHNVATAVPDSAYPQTRIRDAMLAWLGGDRRTERLLRSIYEHSAIETRHSVLRDLDPGPGRSGFYSGAAGELRRPGTRERNELYAKEAPRLYACAARAALAGSPGLTPADVTHVITVSCTGFFAPGPDVLLIDELGLAPDVERYHVGFMGCYAAFPALRMAEAFCRADPGSVVLLVTAELCTLHLQPDREPDSMIAASVFADGAAAAVVSARAPAGRGARLEGFASTLAPEGASEMAWTLGDTGFEMVLSSYVPRVVGARISEAVAPLFDRTGVPRGAVARWAVHPGGRAILDRVEAGLCLPPEALAASRSVLRRYGNMSSATVLFVLERLLGTADAGPEPVAAVAFGPGLSVESGLFTLLPGGGP